MKAFFKFVLKPTGKESFNLNKSPFDHQTGLKKAAIAPLRWGCGIFFTFEILKQLNNLNQFFMVFCSLMKAEIIQLNNFALDPCDIVSFGPYVLTGSMG